MGNNHSVNNNNLGEESINDRQTDNDRGNNSNERISNQNASNNKRSLFVLRRRPRFMVTRAQAMAHLHEPSNGDGQIQDIIYREEDPRQTKSAPF